MWANPTHTPYLRGGYRALPELFGAGNRAGRQVSRRDSATAKRPSITRSSTSRATYDPSGSDAQPGKRGSAPSKSDDPVYISPRRSPATSSRAHSSPLRKPRTPSGHAATADASRTTLPQADRELPPQSFRDRRQRCRCRGLVLRCVEIPRRREG